MFSNVALSATVNRLQRFIRHTPYLDVEVPTTAGNQRVLLKLEYLQFSGSFKARGALNKVAGTALPSVVAVSGGNHGIAVAYAAQVHSKSATIFVNRTMATEFKKNKILSHGAKLVQCEENMIEIFKLAEQYCSDHKGCFVHPYDDPEVILGASTLGYEIAQVQSYNPHDWYVSVGGGGLYAGSLISLPTRAVHAVESFSCPSLYEAQCAQKPVPVQNGGVAYSGLGAPIIGVHNWSIIERLGQKVIQVTDETITKAQKWLWDRCQILVEPSSAAALAPIFSDTWKLNPQGIGVVLCGANSDEMP